MYRLSFVCLDLVHHYFPTRTLRLSQQSLLSTTIPSSILNGPRSCPYAAQFLWNILGFPPQCMSFFTGNLETSPATLSYCFYLLALHPEIQERVIQEIDEVMNSSDITLEKTSQLVYTDMVIRETLRLYPTVASWVDAPLCINDPMSQFLLFGFLGQFFALQIITRGMGNRVSLFFFHDNCLVLSCSMFF